MSDTIGISIIVFVVSFIIGIFLAIVVQNIKYWLDQRAEAKKITILPDGKGGHITLPPGITYFPMKEEN